MAVVVATSCCTVYAICLVSGRTGNSTPTTSKFLSLSGWKLKFKNHAHATTPHVKYGSDHTEVKSSPV